MFAGQGLLEKSRWVANTLEKSKKQQDMIKHFFLKCGLFNEDDSIKTSRIEDYTILFAEREVTPLKDDEESGSKSKFTEVDTDYSN